MIRRTKAALFHVFSVCILVTVMSHPLAQRSNSSTKTEQDDIGRIPSQGVDTGVINKDQVILSGNRRSFYKFWRTISKNVLPLASFLEKSTMNMIEKYCTILRLSSRLSSGEGCLNVANKLSIMIDPDFPHSPSPTVMGWEGTRHFEKSMYTDVINALRKYENIFKVMLKYEKQRYSEKHNMDPHKIDCSSPRMDEVMSFICQIDSIVISNIRRLIDDIREQGQQYFSLHLPELETLKLPEIPGEPSRRYFNLVAAYRFLEQVKETESSLEYILMLEKSKALRKRRSRAWNLESLSL